MVNRMPVVFAGHGSPMNAIEENRFSKGWKGVAKRIPRPRAILSVSAHWQTEGTKISDSKAPKTVYDMYGFPPELYKVNYPVDGCPLLAHEVCDLLGDRVSIDNGWGIDHASWSVLRWMFPMADVPVVQLSIDENAQPREHYELGRMLRPLRDEGILIFASGNIVHNLSMINWNMQDGYGWANEFNDYVKKKVLAHDTEGLIDYDAAGPCRDNAFLTAEHYCPLLYALGASDDKDQIAVFDDACTLGSISMTGFLFH
jgi:4,5-DOPA dioxygenase extradiol